jgi:hypothetical protein
LTVNQTKGDDSDDDHSIVVMLGADQSGRPVLLGSVWRLVHSKSVGKLHGVQNTL